VFDRLKISPWDDSAKPACFPPKDQFPVLWDLIEIIKVGTHRQCAQAHDEG